MKNILVVDDNKIILEVLSDLLGENYFVITASDGSQVGPLMEEYTFNLIILDLVMPNKEGIETLQEIKTKQPDTKIIVISGKIYASGFDNLTAAKTLGAHKVLKKPFSNEQMLKAVQELID